MSATSAAGRNRRWIFLAWLAAASLALVALGLVSVALLARDERSAPASTPRTETPAEASPPSPSPLAIQTPAIRPVTVVADSVFPPDTSMLIANGSYGHGHGGYFSLIRFTRFGVGPLISEKLLGPPRESGTVNMTSLVAAPGGSPLFAAICFGEQCPLEGAGEKQVFTSFLRSADGGVTWQEVGRRDGEWWLAGVVGGEALALRFTTGSKLVLLPSGQAVQAPPETAVTGIAPATVIGGLPVWEARNKAALVNASGETVFAPDVAPDLRLIDVWALDSERLAAAFYVAGAGPSRYFFGIFNEDGRAESLIELGAQSFLSAVSSSQRVLVTATYDRAGTCTAQGRTIGAAPAILDPSDATLSYIADPFIPPEGCTWGTQRVLAVSHGPFARVNTPGDCLRIRVSPRLDANVLDCAATGVLLRHSNLARSDNEGRTWLNITTPAGEQGWAAADYLER